MRQIAEESHSKYVVEVAEARAKLRQVMALKRANFKMLRSITAQLASAGVRSYVTAKLKKAVKPVATKTKSPPPVDKNTSCVQCKFLWGVFRGGKGRGGKKHTCEKWYRVAQQEKRDKERLKLKAEGKWPVTAAPRAAPARPSA